MAVFNLEDESVIELHERIKAFPGNSEKVITETLHTEGAEFIKEGIDRLLPRSGRKPWKGKKRAAADNKNSIKLRKTESGNLNVVVGTTSSYHYLYFPDDGTNTTSHVGNQQFMLKGAEDSQDRIMEACIKNLIEQIETN